MPKTVLHFDAVDGQENYDAEFYNRNKVRYGTQTASHTFNTKITLANPIDKAKSVTLLSCEMPFNFFNCRSENYSNSLSFVILYGGVVSNLNITLNPKNYISVTDLLFDINAAITSRSPAEYPNLVGFEMIFGLSPLNSYKITIKTNADTYLDNNFTTCANVTINKSVLGLMLGISFNKNITQPDIFLYITGTPYSILTASGAYTLQPDNYVLLNFTNIRKTTSANNRMSSFKIVLNGSFGEILSYEPTYRQTIQLDDQLIDHLNIKITDRNGNSIWGNSGYVSFSVEIEH